MSGWFLPQAIANKETVAITNFGRFYPKEVGAREYRNIQDPTGPLVPKPATTRVGFKPFKHFKDCVAEGRGAGRDP